ncbi:hypothetical protein MtrunA17_Chr4g0065971 [Medicago truncatula]|uniref:Uncharacterized protein n=1 Tax=Medicago truncatula TaxID=3880 RepID=A0A396IEY8_MEDTR|nr:hypothetical protein MtrunA17_Chr4g0065971 [Medicago truncatula]
MPRLIHEMAGLHLFRDHFLANSFFSAIFTSSSNSYANYSPKDEITSQESDHLDDIN